MDFLNLESESAEALKTYLTEEEAALLREEEGEGGGATVVMVEEAREQLTAIVSVFYIRVFKCPSLPLTSSFSSEQNTGLGAAKDTNALPCCECKGQL